MTEKWKHYEEYYNEADIQRMIKDIKHFKKWISGQTAPVVEDEDNPFCYYVWDVDRYIRYYQDGKAADAV